MKAISLWQPWASLWAIGSKLNETRHWPTRYRGPLIIHAAKLLCADVPPELAIILVDRFGSQWRRSLPGGALIGICELIDCTPTEQWNLSSQEEAQGNYTRGRFAWCGANHQLWDVPIPWKGAQGFFEVPDLAIAAAGHSIQIQQHPQGELL